jgi:hypothetical protein
MQNDTKKGIDTCGVRIHVPLEKEQQKARHTIWSYNPMDGVFLKGGFCRPASLGLVGRTKGVF